jgi:hypothetical protein
MGVVGLLLGGIWGVASVKTLNDEVSQSLDLLDEITQGIRDQMQDRPFSAVGDITQNMINTNVIPAWTIVNGVAKDPWNDGGSIDIVAGSGGLRTFAVGFVGGNKVIPPVICTRVVLEIAQCSITDIGCPQSVMAITGVATIGQPAPSLTLIPSSNLTVTTVEAFCANAHDLYFQYSL